MANTSSRAPAVGPDTVIGDRYTVERRIGKGTMGTVYLARDADGGHVALKLMKSSLFDDPKAAHRFEREARLGASLNVPGIVAVRDTGQDAKLDMLWMALDYVDGVTLNAWREAQTEITPETARSVIVQLLTAMAAVHEQGVIHRDLKPENILVTDKPDGPRVHILDLGIAKSAMSSTIQNTTAGMGAPAWTAPEQAKLGYVPSPVGDVWALGLIAFYIYTGEQYWLHSRGQSLANFALEVTAGDILSPEDRCLEFGIDAHFPPDFNEWFVRCVDRNVDRRLPNAGAALRVYRGEAMSEAIEAPPNEAASGPIDDRPDDRPGVTRLPNWLILTLLYGGLIAFAAWLYWLVKG